MRDHVRELEAALDAWRRRNWPKPSTLLVSGSGLAVDLDFEVVERTTLADVLPFEVEAVVGHPLEVELLAAPHGLVLYQRGRLHSYQGYDAHRTVFLVRLAALLGAGTLIMTNAAGGLHPDLRAGRLAIIRDQINLIGLNPLRGSVPADWGPRFPDLVDAFDPGLRELAAAVAGELGIDMGEGVYAGVAGPSFETPAEVAMLRRLGADLVGMSTVLEVIAARHIGMQCLCFSLVANLAAGVTDQPLTHDEVLEAGRGAAGDVARLLDALLRRPELFVRRSR